MKLNILVLEHIRLRLKRIRLRLKAFYALIISGVIRCQSIVQIVDQLLTTIDKLEKMDDAGRVWVTTTSQHWSINESEIIESRPRRMSAWDGQTYTGRRPTYRRMGESSDALVTDLCVSLYGVVVRARRTSLCSPFVRTNRQKNNENTIHHYWQNRCSAYTTSLYYTRLGR